MAAPSVPVEVWLLIAGHLDAPSAVLLARTCKSFHSAIHTSRTAWVSILNTTYMQASAAPHSVRTADMPVAKLILAASRPYCLEHLILSREDFEESDDEDSDDSSEGNSGVLTMLKHEKVLFHWSLNNLFHWSTKFKLLRGGRWVLGLGISHKDMILCCWDLHQNRAGVELHAAAELVWENEIDGDYCTPEFEAQYYDEKAVNCLVVYTTGQYGSSEKDVVEVVQIKFTDGNPVIERRELVTDDGVSPSHERQMLYGDLLCTDDRGFAIVRNWSTGKQLQLHKYTDRQTYPATSVHRNVAFVTTAPDNGNAQQFDLYDVSQLLHGTGDPAQSNLSANNLGTIHLSAISTRGDTLPFSDSATFRPVDGWLPPSCEQFDVILEDDTTAASFTLASNPGSGSYVILGSSSTYERDTDTDAAAALSVQLLPGHGSHIEIYPSERYSGFPDSYADPERGFLVSTRTGTVKSFEFDIQHRHRVVPEDFDPLSGIVFCRPDPEAYGPEGHDYYHEWGNPNLPKPGPGLSRWDSGDDHAPTSQSTGSDGGDSELEGAWETESEDEDGEDEGSGDGGNEEEDDEFEEGRSDQDVDSDENADFDADSYIQARKERRGQPHVIACQLSYIID